mmetsp:Transcript_91114/g.162175  ORF Transcript_91114/g.162175 Transcript_91114/m.162175 type:complete len:1004 (+) Transcript_91114:43-3054(+)
MAFALLALACLPGVESGLRPVGSPEGLEHAPLACNAPLQTDSSNLEDLSQCPQACPFLVPNPKIKCIFHCTNASTCSSWNPEFAHPNPDSRLCEPCHIQGCRICSSPDTCGECFPSFMLSGEACMYEWDVRAEWSLQTAFTILVLGVVVAAIALVGLSLWRWLAESVGFLPPAEPQGEGIQEHSSTADHTFETIKQGLRHRLRCKIKDMVQTGPGLPVKRNISLWVNLQEHFLAGIGLPLFHAWFTFITMYGLAMALGVFWIYQGSDLGSTLHSTGLQRASHTVVDWIKAREGIQASSSCSADSLQLSKSMRQFAERAAAGYAGLWILGSAATLAHAARQQRLARAFERRHPRLADFALSVEGFPPEAIDESAIRDFLREKLHCQSLEVSVCYDFRAHRKRLYELLEKVIVAADVQAGAYSRSLASEHSVGLSDVEREEVRRWLGTEGGAGLRNAGSVFAIFPNRCDPAELGLGSGTSRRFGQRRMTRQGTELLPLAPRLESAGLHWKRPNGETCELRIRDVVSEPPDVAWDQLAVTGKEFAFRVAAGVVIIGACCALVACVVFVPFASYVLRYMGEVGSQPTGTLMSVMGILVMGGNWVMCYVLWQVASHVGFHRTDRLDLVVFKVFSTICSANFLFNVAILVFPQGLHSLLIPLNDVSLQDVSFEQEASTKLLNVLIPGGLFIGYIMWPLQGFLWPMLASLACLRYRSSCRQQVSAREAELSLEPLGISLAHDYMGHVVQPTCCCLMLFFASDAAWQAFLGLALWSAFMILFQRYLHLRACKRYYFTTSRLDTEVMYAWGLPLSTVLAASCFWAARLRGWHMLTVAGAWLAGFAFHTLALRICLRPVDHPKLEAAGELQPSLAEVSSHRLYDWHNCNPAKVLLSHIETGFGLVPYEVGKEYLQLPYLLRNEPRELPSASRAVTFHGDGQAMAPEIEALLLRPYDAVAAAWDRLQSDATVGSPTEVSPRESRPKTLLESRQSRSRSDQKLKTSQASDSKIAR